MNGWMKAGGVVAAGLAGILAMEGCSSKVETVPGPAASYAEGSEKTVKTQPAISAAVTPMTTDERYTRALKLFDEGSCEEAERQFEIVCNEWPKFSKPFKHLARAQLKLGKFEEAVENAQTASELNPKDGTVDNVLGMAYMEIDDFDSAEAAFKSSIGKLPDYAWAYNNLGYLMIQKKDFAAARDILTEGGKLEKAPSVLFNNLGIALEQTGDTTGAKEAFARAVEKNPNNEKAATNLARMESLLPTTPGQEITRAPENR